MALVQPTDNSDDTINQFIDNYMAFLEKRVSITSPCDSNEDKLGSANKRNQLSLQNKRIDAKR